MNENWIFFRTRVAYKWCKIIYSPPRSPSCFPTSGKKGSIGAVAGKEKGGDAHTEIITNVLVMIRIKKEIQHMN